MARSITLIELSLAICLISLVVISTGTLYTAAVGFFEIFDTQAQMQNQANVALQDMIKNIYLSEKVDIINNSEIEVTPITGVSLIRYRQDDIYIKRNNEIIARGVKELKFSQSTTNPDTQRETLRIDLIMASNGRLIDLKFTTKVTPRKYE